MPFPISLNKTTHTLFQKRVVFFFFSMRSHMLRPNKIIRLKSFQILISTVSVISRKVKKPSRIATTGSATPQTRSVVCLSTSRRHVSSRTPQLKT
jgi:hypothetical protein